MRRLRTLTFFLSIAITIGLICIGFSSWTISGSFVGVSGIGGLNSYSVIDVSEYISLDTSKGDSNTGITPFQFNSNGFINVTNESALDGFGRISVHYILNREKCIEAFGENCSITVDFYLRATAADGINSIDFEIIHFDKCYLQYVDNNVSVTTTHPELTNNDSKNLKHTLTFDLSIAEEQDSYDSITFSLNYDFETQTDFNSLVYSKLYNGTSTATFYTYVQIYQTTAS